MDFSYTFEKLKNGIDIFNIKDPNKLISMLVVAIKRGASDDPISYGGTHHYIEHILGSYFEYSKYGSNYDHLSMMNGSTVSSFLHIYKRFLFDESVINSLIDNLCVFIESDRLDKNILENEKWMVNNETTSKLYDYPLMNIFFIYEQLQSDRTWSTFGRINSLNEQVLMDVKKTFVGNDYSIFLINVPDSNVKRQMKTLSRIKFLNRTPMSHLDKLFLNPPANQHKLVGKNILTINSTYNISCMIFPQVEPALLLYMQSTGNEVYDFLWNNKPFVFQSYNDSLVVYTNEINNTSCSDDDLVRVYIEAYIQFLYKIIKAPVVDNVLYFVYFYCNLVTNPIYYDIMKSCNLSANLNTKVYNKSVYETRKCTDTTYISEIIGEGKNISKLIEKMDMFIETFEPKFPSKIDFLLARMTNMPTNNSFDKFNKDTGMYFSLVPYEKHVNIDVHRLLSTLNSDLLLTINIDYSTGMIYSNAFSSTNRTTYLCIELELEENAIGFIIFYFLSGCMPYYYTIYDDKKMIMNCTYQSEKKIIESNLEQVKYSDLYELTTKLKSSNYDIMNSKNSFFFLIVNYLNKIDLARLYMRGKERVFGVDSLNKFKMHLMNYSKMISTETPVHMNTYKISRSGLDMSSLLLLAKDYLIIYNECDDIILSYIFIQYIYSLMQKLSKMRRIYMSNIRSGVDGDFYIILLNVQIKNIRSEILDLYDSLEDKLEDFDIDISVILINIIKLMLYYNMNKFRSQFDIYSSDMLKEFIDLQMKKMRIFGGM